eukprot:Gb_02561 [translate_table: standard]
MRLFVRCIQKANIATATASNLLSKSHIRRRKNADGINHCGDRRLEETRGILDVFMDSETYASLLEGCANVKSLAVGMQVHARMLIAGIQPNVYLWNKLASMYANCGSMEYARLVFDAIPQPNMFSWNAMIAGYAGYGYYEEALGYYYLMQSCGVQPDNFMFSCVLKVCAGIVALQQGKEIHSCIIRSGFESYVFVGNALIDMYAKCGNVDDAVQVFDNMSHTDIVSWTAMIAGYVQNGYCDKALELFHRMQLAGLKPNSVTIASVLPACARLAVLETGKEIHSYIIRGGFESDAAVGSALLAFYSKSGRMENARHVFDRMSERDVVSWNAIISGYAQNGQCHESLNLFHQMQVAGLKPNMITWNAMIAGYAQNGLGGESLERFRQMERAETKPNSITIASILSACSCLADLEKGKEIHDYIIRNGFELDALVGSALVAMYAKCGSVEDAGQVFDKLTHKDVISWTSMIVGYTQSGYSDQALKVFRQMQLAGMKPDLVTLVSVLPAFAYLAALQKGKEVHDYIIRNGFESDVIVSSSLVAMYAKCGSLEDARHVFDKISHRDVVSWNAMLAGYAMHGLGKDAFTLFCQMQQTGMTPDHVTFISVLSACSYAGLVEEGWQCFDCMGCNYQIQPSMEHYACMVDLLGRCGRLYEAHDFITNMPSEANAIVWGALLGACRMHCNIELGELAAERLFELEPENVGSYVLLSNMYAAAGKWDDVTKVRKMMKDKRLKKRPGCSWIEVNNRVHVFVVGDRSHPEKERLYEMLESLDGQMKATGYVRDTQFVLHDVEEEEKEHILCGHSEKLAIVFGLLNAHPGKPIRVMKNLRVCHDCHIAIKFISKIVQREIIVRDAIRFHHFNDGVCSCRDYW